MRWFPVSFIECFLISFGSYFWKTTWAYYKEFFLYFSFELKKLMANAYYIESDIKFCALSSFLVGDYKLTSILEEWLWLDE